MNAWQYAKGGPTTLGFLDRNDIPFHYALADAYTIGDAYHCSVLSATGPNRTYLWSGTINAGQENGTLRRLQRRRRARQVPAVAELRRDAAEGRRDAGRSTRAATTTATTARSTSRRSPTSTRAGRHRPAPGTNVYYDNGLATVPEPLDPETFNADNLANAIKADVLAGTLPQVTWVVTNQQYSEHPDGAPTDGAYYIGKVLRRWTPTPTCSTPPW